MGGMRRVTRAAAREWWGWQEHRSQQLGNRTPAIIPPPPVRPRPDPSGLPTRRAAQHGGGVLAHGAAAVTLGGLLEGNEAGGDGGGVAALGGAAVRLASTAHLHANAAQGSGGGAFLAGASATVGAPAPLMPCPPGLGSASIS